MLFHQCGAARGMPAAPFLASTTGSVQRKPIAKPGAVMVKCKGAHPATNHVCGYPGRRTCPHACGLTAGPQTLNKRQQRGQDPTRKPMTAGCAAAAAACGASRRTTALGAAPARGWGRGTPAPGGTAAAASPPAPRRHRRMRRAWALPAGWPPATTCTRFTVARHFHSCCNMKSASLQPFKGYRAGNAW